MPSSLSRPPFVRRGELGDQIRDAVVEAVLDCGVYGGVGIVMSPAEVIEPDLERVGAGHVRQRGLRLNDRGRRLLRVDAAQRAIRQSRDGAALFGDADELAVVALQFVPADVLPDFAVIRAAHFEQQAVESGDVQLASMIWFVGKR
jgi:hypothetical protein